MVCRVKARRTQKNERCDFMRVVERVAPIAPALPAKKRVAAYARVSIRKEKSLQSLSAQISHYSELIQKRHDWEYAGVYADEAITGTKDSRPEFQRLMEDCRAGKIDIVLVKSISRFARNTVTMLETVRELKALNIDVWFENENIRSLSGDGELMLTILASFAQEESLSNSENMKWKFKKRFEQGRPSTTVMLGYKLVGDNLVIIPEEAEIVRFIFNEFVNGVSRTEIRNKLAVSDYRPKNGGEWHYSTINCMLRNEKYAGTLVLQKFFRENHISKKVLRNNGELPMYRVEDSHPAIIDKATFEKAQELLAETYLPRNAKRHRPVNGQPKPTKSKRAKHPFAEKIICGLCGKPYGRSVSRKGQEAEYVSWHCYTYARYGKAVCSAPPMPERVIAGIGLDFVSVLIQDSETLMVKLPDGIETKMNWQRPKCKDAWTEEKRQQARKKAIAGWERSKAICQSSLQE